MRLHGGVARRACLEVVRDEVGVCIGRDVVWVGGSGGGGVRVGISGTGGCAGGEGGYCG